MTQGGPRPIQLDESWKTALADEFTAPYMRDLRSFLEREYASGKVIYPAGREYFQALNLTPLPKVKVVILGQDPYHGPGQAHGLCFSVRPGTPPPPSLVNIFKELKSDLGIAAPNPLHGCLESWAHQGVLLLNCVLTVEHGQAGSHAGQGWERFTDRVIEVLNQSRSGLVFVLWGSYAQKKGQFIDRQRHLVLTSAHPSPLSAYRGFFGSKPFSIINEYLISHGQTAIEWQLPSLGIAPRPKAPRQIESAAL
jgi:uracil-DNA glycosylase